MGGLFFDRRPDGVRRLLHRYHGLVHVRIEVLAHQTPYVASISIFKFAPKPCFFSVPLVLAGWGCEQLFRVATLVVFVAGVRSNLQFEFEF